MKGLSERIRIEFGRIAEPRGIVRRGKSNSFRRRLEGGCGSLNLCSIVHHDDIDVVLDMAVRIDAVQELLERHGVLDPDSFTMGCESGNLTEGRQRRWTVASEDDTVRVAGELARVVDAVVIPYWERYIVPAEALALLRRNDPVGWLHSPFHHYRAMQAIATARVVGGTTLMEEVAASSEAWLRGRNEQGIDVFRRFLEQLRGDPGSAAQ